MKLRTCLQLSAILPIVLAIIVSLGRFVGSHDTRKIAPALKQASGLIDQISELDRATHEYVVSRSDSAAADWEERHSMLGERLDETKFRGSLERYHVIRLRDAFETASEVFSQLSSSDEADGWQLRKKMLRLQLIDEIKTMNSEAFELSGAAISSASDARNSTGTMVAVVVGMLSLVMAGTILGVSRHLMKRISALQDGIGNVSKGELGKELQFEGNDELDELSATFNEMSLRLQKSHDALKNEAEEHRSSAEALRKANVMVSDALVKLKRAQRKVVETERFGALSQMAAGIVHDFNSALTPIMGFTDIWLAYPEKLKDVDSVATEIETINRSAKKARAQIRRLTQFFRPAKEADVKPANLNDIIEAAVKFTEPMWREEASAKGRTVDISLMLTEIPLVQVNASALQEAIAGVIFNAVESMSEGGTITITSRFDDKSIAIEVRDTGAGMADQIRERCLEPFFSTKGSGAAGMGLTVASGIAKRHDGRLEVASRPGFGTAVTIWLPFRAQSVPGGQPPAEGLDPSRVLKLLVVDDDRLAGEVCGKVLRTWGHEVDIVASGAEALDRIPGTKYDAVLADRAMPHMSGDELVIAIKRQVPDIPFVLLTGFGDVMKKHGEHPEGVDIILDKPISLDELKEGLEKAMTLKPSAVSPAPEPGPDEGESSPPPKTNKKSPVTRIKDKTEGGQDFTWVD